ncbi:transposase [Candidatus Magnetominusculus dajiuhuensis]|uniref:transposase n=1 Tax=Candidatus Magnetominusculus dajiuhuensis TaxID=3137712 RepID=UPI003B4289AA
MGEGQNKGELKKSYGISVDTYGGKVHVEWNPEAAVTPLGQLPFFINFIKVSGLYDAFIEECPLQYGSSNAPTKEDVLGTLLLSVLAGQRRYAHITAIRSDGVNPSLLGMTKVVSEDSARRALKGMDEQQGVEWLETQLSRVTRPALSIGPWILDVDTTVKCLYGKQEGAVVGYNPVKPGRPCHSYHSYFMANTRLSLTVEVNAGNHSSSHHVAPGLWQLIESLPENKRPAFIRADVAFGVEPILAEAEARGIHYLSKLRLTSNVKRLIKKLFNSDSWVDAGYGFSGTEAVLQLSGWSKSRRVIVIRRELMGEVAMVDGNTPEQLDLAFVETLDKVKRYEYAVLVTSMQDEILTIAQHYRDRADMENCLDELKNQWGWGGYTTHDIKRCRMISRIVALIYDWWSIFVRLANPTKHHEALTSRPLLLHAVAKQTKHSGQTNITITSTHARAGDVQVVLIALAAFLKKLKTYAEHLNTAEKMKIIITCAFRLILQKPPAQPFYFALMPGAFDT